MLKKAALILLGLCMAQGQLRAYDYNGKWGIEGSGGINTQAMGDVDHTLSQFGGAINYGWEAGLGASYGLSSNLLINFGFGEIGNKDSFHGGTISLPALSFMAGGEYVALKSGNFDLGIGGAVEYDMLDGYASVDPAVIAGGSVSLRPKAAGWAGPPPGGPAPSGQSYYVTECSGSTVGGQLSLRGRYFLSSNWALGLEAGYRYSHVYQVTGTHDGISGPESETVDYSGILSKLSVACYF